jgi:hypothetical protein
LRTTVSIANPATAALKWIGTQSGAGRNATGPLVAELTGVTTGAVAFSTADTTEKGAAVATLTAAEKPKLTHAQAERRAAAARTKAGVVRTTADAESFAAAVLTGRTAITGSGGAAKGVAFALRAADIAVGQPEAGGIRSATDPGRDTAFLSERAALRRRIASAVGRSARAVVRAGWAAVQSRGDAHEQPARRPHTFTAASRGRDATSDSDRPYLRLSGQTPATLALLGIHDKQ